MSHNPRIRPPGLWVAVTVIDPDELETFDLRQFESINGDQGGTWAPATPIVIGGDGIHVAGRLEASAQVTISNQATFVTGSSLEMDGGSSALFGGTVSFEDAVSFESGCTAELKSGATLDAKSGSTTTVESGATVTIDAGAVVEVASDVTFTGAIIRSGADARFRSTSRVEFVNDSDALVGVDVDVVIVSTTVAVTRIADVADRRFDLRGLDHARREPVPSSRRPEGVAGAARSFRGGHRAPFTRGGPPVPRERSHPCRAAGSVRLRLRHRRSAW